MERTMDSPHLDACFRVFNGAEPTLDELFADDVAVQALIPGLPATLRRGRDAVESLLAFFHTPFPDIRFEPVASYCQGTTSTCKWVARGTHQGPLFFNIAPLFVPIELTGAFMCQVAAGRITRFWVRCDLEALLAQLGMAPSAPETSDSARATPEDFAAGSRQPRPGPAVVEEEATCTRSSR